MPPNPVIERADRSRMKYPPYLFDSDVLRAIGEAIGRSLVDRQSIEIYAMTVQTWHVHLVVARTVVSLNRIVKCAKDAARWHLRAGRPIWGGGYDKRFCFDGESLRGRIEYVERHNTELGWDPRPWDFIVTPPHPG